MRIFEKQIKVIWKYLKYMQQHKMKMIKVPYHIENELLKLSVEWVQLTVCNRLASTCVQDASYIIIHYQKMKLLIML